MRLEVRSLGNGLRREHIGVFDADTGKRIEWVQSVKLKFNVEGAARLKLVVLNNPKTGKNDFVIREDELYEDAPAITYTPTGHKLYNISSWSQELSDRVVFEVIDFDLNLNVNRPFKQETK